MTRSIIIVGAGGHAGVVADALLSAGGNITGFTDADEGLVGSTVLGLPVLGTDDLLTSGNWPECDLVNGLGQASARAAVQTTLEAMGRRFTGVRHPSAIISNFARIDPTAQVLAGAIVQAGAEIGQGCVVNTGAIVEHDCLVGAFSHCAPGSILCGGVRLGAFVHIGAGAVVREGITLGDAITVGAGAAVVRSHGKSGWLLGVPARPRPAR